MGKKMPARKRRRRRGQERVWTVVRHGADSVDLPAARLDGARRGWARDEEGRQGVAEAKEKKKVEEEAAIDRLVARGDGSQVGCSSCVGEKRAEEAEVARPRHSRQHPPVPDNQAQE